MLVHSYRKSLRKLMVLQLCLALILTFVITILPSEKSKAYADTITQNNAQRIVQQYKGVWTSAPTNDNYTMTPDSPLLGNGDVGVTLVKNIDSMVNIIGKNEFWSLSGGNVMSMARLSFSIPGMAGASYYMEQNIANAELDGTFTYSGNTINTASWVQATDTTNNMYFTKFTYTGTTSQNVAVSLAQGNGNTYPKSVSSSGDVLYIDVQGDSTDTVSGYATHKVRVATRIIGTTGTITNNTLNFTLQPGNTYTLATCIMSNYDDSNYQSLAISNISTKAQTNVDTLKTSHQGWWDNFWGKSFVEIPNKTLEKSFYGSLYLLASSSRTGETAPGLWANWSATPGVYNNWYGDYHTNYNYETPFYFAMPTNHTELADAYDKPVLDWIPNGQSAATSNGFSGVYYGVAIGPLPNGSADKAFWNQKSNAAFAATDMLMHFYATYDATYANSIYAYLKQVAAFWQNYLYWDGTRYVDQNDAQFEGDAYPQTNGVMSLGFIRYVLQGCIDISTTLNVDATLRTTWQNIVSNLSNYPTTTQQNVTVFNVTEVGRGWTPSGIPTMPIYPGNQIGLYSDPTLLQTAKNTVGVLQGWNNLLIYPAAARVAYNPDGILGQLTSYVQSKSYNNFHIHTTGGGIENLNGVPATISEMLLQSFQGTVKVFPNWPRYTNGKFGDLRADGAFLISSDIRTNQVQYLRIISEKGRDFTFENPWPGQTLHIYRNGTDSGTLSGSTITITTSVNETIHIAPDGISYTTITNLMNQPMSTSTPINIASQATATASSQNSSSFVPSNAIDGSDISEWISSSELNPWIKLNWSTPQIINTITLFDRNNLIDQANGGTLTFSDGSQITVTGIPMDGTGKEITFPTKSVAWVKFQVSGGSGANVGLSEVKIYNTDAIPAPPNLALGSTVTGSSQYSSSLAPSKATDGNYSTEWASLNELNPWLKLNWSTSQTMNKIVLSDRPNTVDWAPGGTLTFSDGSSITVTGIPNDGSPKIIYFPNKTVTWVKFQVSGGSGSNVGLSELQAYLAPVDFAQIATVTGSSQYDGTLTPSKAVDGLPNTEWASLHELNPWLQLDWSSSQTINKINLYDRPNSVDWALGGTLTFSDGSSVPVTGIPNDGTALTVTFPSKTVTWVKFQVSGGSGANVGLSEIEAFGP